MRWSLVVLAALALAAGSCAGSDAVTDSDAGVDSGDTSSAGPAPVVEAAGEPPAFVFDVLAAIDAVEAELGPGQRFFEVTANSQFTNVFVAVDDGTAAIAYAYVDGELQPAAPKQTGAEGQTFGRDDVTFDPELIVSGVMADLPESDVDAISVYGDGIGATYVLAATSEVGGFLDIVVGPQGQVFSVDPV